MDYLEKTDIPVEVLYNIWISTDSNQEKTAEHVNKVRTSCLINLSKRFLDRTLKCSEKIKINVPLQLTDLDEPQLLKTFKVICDLIDEKFSQLQVVYLVGEGTMIYPVFIILLYIKKHLNLSMESGLRFLNQKLHSPLIPDNFDSVLKRVFMKF